MTRSRHQTLSGDQIKNSEMGGECKTYGGEEGYLQVLLEKRQENKPLERPRIR